MAPYRRVYWQHVSNPADTLLSRFSCIQYAPDVQTLHEVHIPILRERAAVDCTKFDRACSLGPGSLPAGDLDTVLSSTAVSSYHSLVVMVDVMRLPLEIVRSSA